MIFSSLSNINTKYALLKIKLKKNCNKNKEFEYVKKKKNSRYLFIFYFKNILFLHLYNTIVSYRYVYFIWNYNYKNIWRLKFILTIFFILSDHWKVIKEIILKWSTTYIIHTLFHKIQNNQYIFILFQSKLTMHVCTHWFKFRHTEYIKATTTNGLEL